MKTRLILLLCCSLAGPALGAADKPDKPEKPDKPDKPERTERRRERDPAAKSTPAAAPAAKAATTAPKSSAPAAKSAPAAPLPPSNFESFAVILEKNIFNPGRVGRVRATEDRSVRTDTISLVGTVRNGDAHVALFDSPDAAFRRNLRAGESVGEFKVREISGEGVVLVRHDQPLTLKVSHQLRRPEGGDWSVVAPPAEVPPAGGLISAAPAAVAIPDNASEVLKRLMKQREKQLKK